MEPQAAPNLITAEMLRSYLSDCQWHTGLQILEHYLPTIPPEAAGQYFWATRKRAKGEEEEAPEIPEDLATRDGVRNMITRAIGTHLASGAVEYVGARGLESRRFRWVAWHCWLCGTRVTGPTTRPDSGLCPVCEIAIVNEPASD